MSNDSQKPLEKNGMLTEKSLADFNTQDKVKFIEKHGFLVAGAEDRDKLEEPVEFRPVKL